MRTDHPVGPGLFISRNLKERSVFDGRDAPGIFIYQELERF
jgi:hypothetical protein